MRNCGYFQFTVTDEQISEALRLAKYSIENHPVHDVYANDTADTYGLSAEERSLRYRFTGTLGEILFADVYGQSRPTRAFGAIDGQDHGKDFSLEMAGQIVVLDVKTMNRNNANLYDYYVLDLPVYQMKKKPRTDRYFHITLIPHDRSDFYKGYDAAFVGSIAKDEIDKYAQFFSAGSLRPNNRKTSVKFSRDTYEVKLSDLISPPDPVVNVLSLKNFQKKTIFIGKRYKTVDNVCPHCGSQLVKKDGPYGEYMQCSNYPTCRYRKSCKSY